MIYKLTKFYISQSRKGRMEGASELFCLTGDSCWLSPYVFERSAAELKISCQYNVFANIRFSLKTSDYIKKVLNYYCRLSCCRRPCRRHRRSQQSVNIYWHFFLHCQHELFNLQPSEIGFFHFISAIIYNFRF